MRKIFHPQVMIGKNLRISNNKSVALNILYVPHNAEKVVRHAYKSKCNLTRENQVILLKITNGEK